MSAWGPGRAAVFEWTVKESLLGYMLRDETFTTQVSGGASFDPERGIRMRGVVGDDGVLRLEGEAVLSAHGGSLAVALVAAELDPEKGLSIADPIDGLPRRMTLVTVKPAEGDEGEAGGQDGAAEAGVAASGDASAAAEGETRRFVTFLGYDADILFMYQYPGRTPFDDIRVTLLG